MRAALGRAGNGSRLQRTPQLRFNGMACSRSTTLRAVRSAPIQMTMSPRTRRCGRAFSLVGSLNKSAILGRSRTGTLWADTISSTRTTAARMLLGGTTTPALAATVAAYTCGVPTCVNCHSDDMTMCSWRWRIVRGRGLKVTAAGLPDVPTPFSVQRRLCEHAPPQCSVPARAQNSVVARFE